jgi:hypothetical protein
MAIGNQKQEITNRLKFNLFTPSPGGELIFFAPLGAGVNEENQWFLCMTPDTQIILRLLFIQPYSF